MLHQVHVWMMQVMHMEPHEFSELEKVEATDDSGEASTSRPASGDDASPSRALSQSLQAKGRLL